MKSFLVALQFLTIFPVGKVEKVSHEELKKSVRYFPLVGVLQGGVLWGIAHILYSLFPFEAATGLILLVWVLMTGALHLDGLADTVDGLYGGKEKKEILQIMKRGDVGSIGVVALILIILLKFSAIYSLSPEIRFKLLFLTPLVGKGSILFLNLRSKYARERGGLGKAFVEGTTSMELYLTALMTLILTLFLVGFKRVFLIIILVFLIHIGKRYFMSKIGGVTGDVMGATAEVGETFFLLGSLL